MLRILLISAILSLPVAAQSQPVPDANDGKKQEQRTDTKQQTANKAPPSVKSVPKDAADTSHSSESNQDAGTKTSRFSSQWWLNWFYKFVDDPISLFTLVLAISTILLWIDTRGLRKIANKQSTDMTASLGIAQESADTARKMVKQAREEFLATHRPKIRVRQVWQIGEFGQDGVISNGLEIVNIGANPATVTEYSTKLLIRNKEEWLPIPPFYEKQVDPKRPEILSGQSLSLPPLESITLNPISYPAIKSRSDRLYCFGYIKYSDGSGNIRTTAFCRVFEPPGRLQSWSGKGWFIKPDPEIEEYEYQD